MKKFLFGILTLALVLCLLPVLGLDVNATATSRAIPEVSITPCTPAEGMDFSQLTAKVDERAVLQSIHVHDAKTNELVEGSFEHGKFYLIHYVLTPPEGKTFDKRVHFGGSTYFERREDGSVIYEQTFETCDYTLRVNLDINTTKDLYAGMKAEEFEVTVPEDSHFSVKSYTIWDLTSDTECETFENGRQYQLRVTIVPDDNYSLHRSFELECNGYKMGTTCCAAGAYGEATYKFSLNGGTMTVTVPESIKKGYSMSRPGISTSDYSIQAMEIAWLDENLQPYPSSATGETKYFQEGRCYYLTFKLRAYNIFGAWEDLALRIKDGEYTYEIIDNRTIQIYVAYIPTVPMGDIVLTTHGLELGKPIADVTATVEGNGVLSSISVHDNNVYSTVSGGVFKADHVYVITFTIKPVDGYHSDGDSVVVIDGNVENSYVSSGGLKASRSFNTNKKITSAKLTISGMGLGKNISKVKVTKPSDAKFTIYDISMTTTAPSGTTFQKGHHYYVYITLEADDTYCFSRDASVTVSGKEASIVEIGRHDELLECVLDYSYVNEIAKVSLPAMPKSVKQGAALSSNFKVSSSAQYTLEAIWMSMTTGEIVTTANATDCYLLNYVVIPKEGCEFTEDTVFYVDGKKVEPLMYAYYYAQIVKPYNVGLTEISRIDLTLAEPEHGAAPSEVTVSADAAYAVAGAAWGVNTSGKLEDAGETVTTFQNYKYHFLALEMQTNPGYIFSEKVTVFINGNKYATLEDINLGVVYQTVVSFGKLGEIAKLTAPEVSVKNSVISWHGIPNADGYEIYRSTSKSGTYTKVATVAETSWQDSPVRGKSYYYKVKAIFTPDTSKNSGYSAVVTIAYTCDAPVILAQTSDSGKPVITWQKVSGAAKYTVYRATSANGKYTALGTTTKQTYTDSKATVGTTYYYKVIANASKSTYNSGYSNIASCDVICGAPTVTVKVDAASGKPALSWKKVTGATGYRIWRQLPGEEQFVVIAEQTDLSFKDTTAPIDTRCSYMVQTKGKQENLDSYMSDEVAVTSGIARPVVKASVDAGGKPELRWDAVEGAVQYQIYRSTKSSKGYKLLTTVETTGYTDTSVTPGKTFYYKLVAVGQVGKSVETAYVKVSGKCAIPMISVSVNESSGKPVITWEKVSGAKKYTVYQATSETGKYKKLGTTTKLTYTDSKATVGTTYYYKVIANASSSSNNSKYSNIVSCETLCAAPAVTAKVDAASGKPALSWKKITGAAGYEIYRSENGGNWELIKTQTACTFRDDTAAAGTMYCYRVLAVAKKQGCDSFNSAEKSLTATCAQPKIKGKVGETGKPELNWETVEEATKYVIYRSTSSSKNYKIIDETTDLTYTDATAAKGKTYYYKVVAVREESQSAQSAYAKVKSK